MSIAPQSSVPFVKAFGQCLIEPPFSFNFLQMLDVGRSTLPNAMGAYQLRMRRDKQSFWLAIEEYAKSSIHGSLNLNSSIKISGPEFSAALQQSLLCPELLLQEKVPQAQHLKFDYANNTEFALERYSRIPLYIDVKVSESNDGLVYAPLFTFSFTRANKDTKHEVIVDRMLCLKCIENESSLILNILAHPLSFGLDETACYELQKTVEENLKKICSSVQKKLLSQAFGLTPATTPSKKSPRI